MLEILVEKIATARNNDENLYLDVTNMTRDGRNVKIIKANKNTIYALPKNYHYSNLFVLDCEETPTINFYLLINSSYASEIIKEVITSPTFVL